MQRLTTLLSFIFFLFIAQPAYAAFPVNHVETAAPGNTTALQGLEINPRAPQSTPSAPPGKDGGNTDVAEGFAIASFVTGLLFVPILPVVFGAISVANKGARYKGLAIAGLALGILTIVIYVLFIVAFMATA